MWSNLPLRSQTNTFPTAQQEVQNTQIRLFGTFLFWMDSDSLRMTPLTQLKHMKRSACPEPIYCLDQLKIVMAKSCGLWFRKNKISVTTVIWPCEIISSTSPTKMTSHLAILKCHHMVIWAIAKIPVKFYLILVKMYLCGGIWNKLQWQIVSVPKALAAANTDGLSTLLLMSSF